MKSLPPLVELRAFDAAARHMSFTKAALELGVTPTAISHQIKLLERYCGHALFRRRPRPMTLTDAGARMFPAIRSGFATFEGAIVAVRRLSEERPLRVTTTNAFASRWLVPRLPAWQKVRANVPLEVIGLAPLADLIVDNEEKEHLLPLIQARSLEASRFGEGSTKQSHVPAATMRTRSLINIQDGCNAPCTYCMVTSTPSRPL